MADRYTITLPSGEVFDPQAVTPGMERVPGSVMPMTGEQARGTASEYANALLFNQGHRIGALGATHRGEFPSYEEALQDQVRRSEQFRKENPGYAIGADIMGGATSGVGLGGAGITLAGRAPGIIARNVWPWVTRTLEGTAEGVLYGTAQGAGGVYNPGKMGDVLSGAAGGAAMGAVGGAAAPTVGTLAGATYRGVANRGGRIPGQLAEAAQADPASLRAIPGTPGAMLPDANAAMLRQAQGVASAAGPGATALERNLRARNEATGQRIVDFAHREVGQPVIPSFEIEAIRARRGDVGRMMDMVLERPGVRAIDNTRLAEDLDAQVINSRDELQTALRKVRGMLDVTGEPGTLDPHPRVLQQTRKAVRGMEGRARTAGDEETATQLGRVYNRLTEELNDKVAGMRQLNSIYAEQSQQMEALEPTSLGARAFVDAPSGYVRPAELERRLAEEARPIGVNVGPPGTPFRTRQAARDEFERVLRTKDPLAALEGFMGKSPTDANVEKFALLFGQDRADATQAMKATERHRRDVFQKVIEGSQTEPRTAAREAYEPGKEKLISPGATLWGSSLTGLQRGLNALRSGAANATRDRIAGMLATTDPAQQQLVVDDLLAAAPTREARAAITAWLARTGLIGATAAAEQ